MKNLAMSYGPFFFKFFFNKAILENQMITGLEAFLNFTYYELNNCVFE